MTRYAGSASFFKKALILAAVVAGAALLYQLAVIFLLIAAATIVAVCIHLLSDPIHNRLRLGRKPSTAVAILMIALPVAGVSYFFGVEFVRQFNQLIDQLPSAVQSARNEVSDGALGRTLQGLLGSGSADTGQFLGFAKDVISNAFNLLLYIIVVISVGIILSIYPEKYRDGALLLLPKSSRRRVREAANASGRALKGWLLGQLSSMAVVGILTTVGLMLIGLPSWLVLGLFAGAAQFVPVVGPVVSAIPGIFVAASSEDPMLLQTIAVYFVVQQLESNLITPFVMRKLAFLPMALTVVSIIAFTVLFGPAGAFVATPMTLVGMIFVQKLYIMEVLEEDPAVFGGHQFEP